MKGYIGFNDQYIAFPSGKIDRYLCEIPFQAEEKLLHIQQQNSKEQHPKSMNTFIDIEYHDVENVEQSSTMKSTCQKEEKDSGTIIKPREEKQKGKKGKRHYKNQYNWNDTENRRYINFLTKKGNLLNLSLGEKKKLRVNVMMSKFIQTRNSTQCHTHHQKMMEKFHSIEAIIQELSSVFKKPKQIIVQEKAKVEEQISYFLDQGMEQLEIVQIEQVFPQCEPSWVIPVLHINQQQHKAILRKLKNTIKLESYQSK